MSIKGIFPIDKWDFKSGSILSDLPRDDFEMLTINKSDHIYRKGDIVFREGAFPTGIYYIMEGMVKKYKVDKDSKEQIIYVANSGELIGYHAILSAERFPDSAAALGESRIAFIPKEDFLLVLNRSSMFSHRLLKTLSHEFAVLANSITLFAQRSVRERLALQLIVIREKYKADFQPGEPVEINMSREDLASAVGTARENIVRMLTELKQDRIIETRGRKIIVLDVNKLVAIANC